MPIWWRVAQAGRHRHEAQQVSARIQDALTAEIHYRMKNMLTMVIAIVRQTMRGAAALGFGSRLLECAIPSQLGGEGHLSFPTTGVRYALRASMAKIAYREPILAAAAE